MPTSLSWAPTFIARRETQELFRKHVDLLFLDNLIPISIKDPELLYINSLEINWSQLYEDCVFTILPLPW